MFITLVEGDGWSLGVALIRDEDAMALYYGLDFRWIECNYPAGSYIEKYTLTRLRNLDGGDVWWNGEVVTRGWYRARVQ